MKAVSFYIGATLYLSIPKEGHAAMLFMEWCCKFKRGTTLIHKFLDDRETNTILIELSLTTEQAQQAEEYINDNL
jgi:hypothetical protein